MCDIVALTNLDKCDGNNNTGAMHRTFYVVLASEVLTSPTLEDPIVTEEDRVTAITAFILKTGKKFVTVTTEMERVKFTDKQVGNRGSRGYEQSLEAFAPGITSRTVGFGNNLKNADVICVVQDPDNAMMGHVIGSVERPAEMMVDYEAGGKIGDDKGATIKINAKSNSPAMLYPLALGFDVTGA